MGGRARHRGQNHRAALPAKTGSAALCSFYGKSIFPSPLPNRNFVLSRQKTSLRYALSKPGEAVKAPGPVVRFDGFPQQANGRGDRVFSKRTGPFDEIIAAYPPKTVRALFRPGPAPLFGFTNLPAPFFGKLYKLERSFSGKLPGRPAGLPRPAPAAGPNSP